MSQRDKVRKNQVAQNRASRSTGNSAYWQDQFKVPTDHHRTGRFIPGEYTQPDICDDGSVQMVTLEYVMFREHYYAANKRGAICSAGPYYDAKNKAEPCIGCQVFWEDVRARREKKNRGDQSRGPNRMSSRPMYAFNWYDTGLWLKLPRIGANGAPVLKQGTQDPFLDWEPVQSFDAANDPRRNQYESSVGRLVAWPMSVTHKDTLVQYMDQTIMHDCATCGTKGSIRCVSKVCSNPQCQHQVYDPQNSTLTPQQREELESKPYTCPVCAHKGLIQELVACPVCAQYSTPDKVLQPRRATLFDVYFQLWAVKSGDGQQTNLQILDRSNPCPFQGPGPMPAPLDLLAKYTPTSLEKQAELWGIPLITGDQSAIPPLAAPVQQAPAPHWQQQNHPQAYAPQVQQPAGGYMQAPQTQMVPNGYMPPPAYMQPPGYSQVQQPPAQQPAPYYPPQGYPAPGMPYPGQR
jgi:hypothetical protein